MIWKDLKYFLKIKAEDFVTEWEKWVIRLLATAGSGLNYFIFIYVLNPKYLWPDHSIWHFLDPHNLTLNVLLNIQQYFTD